MAEVRDDIRHIVLTGLMGSGKTTVGRALAKRLGWGWRDSDVDIEAATGRTVRELRDEEGVDAMHAREAAQVMDAIAARSEASSAQRRVWWRRPRPETRSPARASRSIWLHASPKILASRFPEGDHRPSYGDDPEAFLAEQAAKREPMVAGLGGVMIDVDPLTPEQVVARAIEALG